MPTAEYPKDPQNHRSAVDVAKSYIDVSHERHDKETAGRDYYHVLDKLDSTYNGIEDPQKKDYVTFTIGENSSFTEAASKAMFDKNFKELKHNQKNIVLNLYLILASQGLEMNKINKQDTWKLDFRNSVFAVTFGGGKKLTGKLEYLKTTKEREDIINSTRAELAGLKSRLTAEAQAILEGRPGTPEHLQGALETGSLVYILKTLENDNVSYENRAQILKDRAKAFTENPGASGMANEIAGINYYLGQWKVEGQFINPGTGEGYKGTDKQNRAWVQVIKDIVKGRELPEYMKHDYHPAEGVPAPVGAISGGAERDARIIGRERTEGEELTPEQRAIVGGPDVPAPEATPAEEPTPAPEAKIYAKEFRDAASDAIGRRITLQSISLSVHQETIDVNGNIAVLIKGNHVEQGGSWREAKVTPLGNLYLNTHYQAEITAQDEAERQIASMESTLAEWEAEAKELDRRAPATAEHRESTPEPEVTPSRDKAEFREKLRMHQEQEVAKYVEQVRIYAGNFAEQNGLSAIETKFQKIPSDDVSRNQYQIIFKMGRMREEAVFSLPSAANAMIQLEQGSDKEYYKKDPDEVMIYDFSSEASAGAEVLGALARLKTKYERREKKEEPKEEKVKIPVPAAATEAPLPQPQSVLDLLNKVVDRQGDHPNESFNREGLEFRLTSRSTGVFQYRATTREGFPVTLRVDEFGVEVGYNYLPQDARRMAPQTVEIDKSEEVEGRITEELRRAGALARVMDGKGVEASTGEVSERLLRERQEQKEKDREEVNKNLKKLGIDSNNVPGSSFEMAGVKFTHSLGIPGQGNMSFEGQVGEKSVLRVIVVDRPSRDEVAYKIHYKFPLQGEPGQARTREYKTFEEFQQMLEQIRSAQKKFEDDLRVARGPVLEPSSVEPIPPLPPLQTEPPTAPGESIPPLSEDSHEAEALAAALEENPLSESAQKIIKEVLRIDSGKAPFEYGGFTFNYQGTVGANEVFYVGDRNSPDLKLSIKIDKNGVANIVLGGEKLRGQEQTTQRFASARALGQFLEGLEK